MKCNKVLSLLNITRQTLCRYVKNDTIKVNELPSGQYDYDEESVYKRGRNAKSYTSAKNASIGDYRRATGFEALMGYLYLGRRYDRMVELVKMALDAFGKIWIGG